MMMALQRIGTLGWDALRADLCATRSECAWSDFGGFHLAPAEALPEAIPSTTHLWAWDATRAVRARIDVDRVLVAALHRVAPPESAAASLTAVDVQRRTGHPWDPSDLHVGRPDVPLPEQEFTLLELTGRTTAVFVRREGHRS